MKHNVLFSGQNMLAISMGGDELTEGDDFHTAEVQDRACLNVLVQLTNNAKVATPPSKSHD